MSGLSDDVHLVAIETERHSVGYEINSEFKKIISNKIKEHTRSPKIIDLSFTHCEGFAGEAVGSESEGESEPRRTEDNSEKRGSRRSKRIVRRRYKANIGGR